jgi:hypothetical protein
MVTVIVPDRPQTVILVHGTFAAPKEGDLQWWQPGSEFCQQLDERLAALESPARTWKNLEDMPVYSWSGNNSWADRYTAAHALAEYLQQLQENRWDFHVIAHSHGGNVLLQALQLRLAPLNFAIEKHRFGNLVCLGTPFIRPLGHRDEDGPRPPWEVGGSAIVIFAVLLASWRYIRPAIPHLGWLWLPLILLFLFRVTSLAIQFLRFKSFPASTPEWKRLLVMSSKRDEVFQLLSQVLGQPNPFARRKQQANSGPAQTVARESNWIRAVGAVIAESDRIRYPRKDLAATHQFFRMRNDYTVLSAAGALIVGVGLHALIPEGLVSRIAQYLTLAAILGLIGSMVLMLGSLTALIALPARALKAARLLAGAAFGQMVEKVFRRYAWSAFRQWLLGTSAFPLKVGSTLFSPLFLRKNFYHVEELPPEAEEAALKAREQDLTGVLAAVTEKLAEPVITDELLHQFETSPTLVHAAYYTHPECLDVIARWIARTDRQIVDEHEDHLDKLEAAMEAQELKRKQRQGRRNQEDR